MKYLSWEFFDGVILLFWCTVLTVGVLGVAFSQTGYIPGPILGIVILIGLEFVTIYRIGDKTGMDIFVPFFATFVISISYTPFKTNEMRMADAMVYAFLAALSWIPLKWIFINWCKPSCKSKKQLVKEQLLDTINAKLNKGF